MYIWPNVHFPENLFSQIYSCYIGVTRGGGPNRNDSSDKFVIKKAILSTVSFLHLELQPVKTFFFGLHLNFGTNAAPQSLKIFFVVFLFWSSLCKLWFGTPNPKIVLQLNFGPRPQSIILDMLMT